MRLSNRKFATIQPSGYPPSKESARRRTFTATPSWSEGLRRSGSSDVRLETPRSLQFALMGCETACTLRIRACSSFLDARHPLRDQFQPGRVSSFISPPPPLPHSCPGPSSSSSISENRGRGGGGGRQQSKPSPAEESSTFRRVNAAFRGVRTAAGQRRNDESPKGSLGANPSWVAPRFKYAANGLIRYATGQRRPIYIQSLRASQDCAHCH